MSGSGLARPVGWNIGRAGLGARVAGAHLAAARLDRGDAGKGLVLGVVTWGRVAFFVAPQSQSCAGGVNHPGSGALEPPVGWFAGNAALLGQSTDVNKKRRGKAFRGAGHSLSTEGDSDGERECWL